MILFIDPGNRAQHHDALDQYFTLRKKVFVDRLGWVEGRDDGRETDRFDEMFNVYVLYVDEETGKVVGGVRLMPTTSDTLLHSVWPDMLDNRRDYRSPRMWEATRFCVDDEGFAYRKGNFINRATFSLCLAVLDFSAVNNITSIVAICEKQFFDMTQTYGVSAELISRKTDENGTDVCFGIWEASHDDPKIQWARHFMGTSAPSTVGMMA